MNDRPLPFSPARFRWAWKLFQSYRAEKKGQFDRALQLLDEAEEIIPLPPSDRVHRAILLLRAQRIPEAHASFAALRDEFKGSDNPNRQYLRHYCTSQLSLMARSGQWSYEAKQAKRIDCSRSIETRFPMVTADELWEDFQPRS